MTTETVDLLRAALRSHGFDVSCLNSPADRAAAQREARGRGLNNLACAIEWYAWSNAFYVVTELGPYVVPPETVEQARCGDTLARAHLGHGPADPMRHSTCNAAAHEHARP